MSICEENESFENWLRARCAVVESDLAYKHHRMKKSPFIFLRATYFRWARTIARSYPDAPKAPEILSVGDIHIENYGVWRDREGRLVWGVNDFDEAAIMPYHCDLVRLAVSALLSDEFGQDLEAISSDILEGYRRGLAEPSAVVLDKDNTWLRSAVMCSPSKRKEFWEELDACWDAEPPQAALDVLRNALPDGARLKRLIERRKVGGGGLGKPRYAAFAEWRGGPVVREVKAATPSAWQWAFDTGIVKSDAITLASGPHRAPDPHLDLQRDFFVRRLAPDNRKIERRDLDAPDRRLPQIVQLMGQELGSLHSGAMSKAIAHDLEARRKNWLADAAEGAADAVRADFHEWNACA